MIYRRSWRNVSFVLSLLDEGNIFQFCSPLIPDFLYPFLNVWSFWDNRSSIFAACLPFRSKNLCIDPFAVMDLPCRLILHNDAERILKAIRTGKFERLFGRL